MDLNCLTTKNEFRINSQSLFVTPNDIRFYSVNLNKSIAILNFFLNSRDKFYFIWYAKENNYLITELLREKYAVPLDSATTICSNFLRSFRNCPDNAPMDLDTWRHLLWSRALGDQYRNIAGDIYFKWLHLRYVYLALTSEIKFMLQKLRENYMLGLITNGPTAAQWEKINRLGLQVYFDVALVSGDLPWEKPNPRIFYKACEYLGVDPKQCIMVGDKLETDIFGGISAKLGGTVLLPLEPISNINELKPLPDYVIDVVTDLPSILSRNPNVPGFRHKLENKKYKSYVSVPDLEDCNSNSSDGS